MGIFDRSQPDPDTAELLNLKAEFEDLCVAESERLSRMDQYRAENNFARDVNLQDRIGGRNLTGADYGRNAREEDQQRHNIPLPFGKALTVKHAYRIAGQLPDCIVDQRDNTPQERHRSNVMEKIVWAIMRASGGETTLASGAWDASELGSASFDLYYDVKTEMPIFRRCDPAGVLVVPGVDDPHDFQRVYRAWKVPTKSLRAEYRDQSFRNQPVDVGAVSATEVVGGQDVTTVVQFCDRTRQLRFAVSKSGAVGLYEYVHAYGFVPHVVIPNVGPYEDIFGWADYEFVRSLQGYIGNLFSREADVLRGVANGAMIEKGTGANPDTVQAVVKRGGVLPSKRDGEVSPIEAPQMPGFHESHNERAMEMLKMLGFAPDAAWGKPGSSSGTDRGLMLQPLMEYTSMKQLNWQKGLARLFGMAYRMIEMKMVTTVTYRGAVPGRMKGAQSPFTMMLGPDAPLLNELDGTTDEYTGMPNEVDLPRSPKELFDGDYCVRFLWTNRLDPDDPRYSTAEVAKFTSGLQSLQTTLERLGFQAPEDEMRRIEQEAKRFPWINQGLVSLIMAQIKGNQQGEGGGGSQADTSALAGGAADTMGAPGGQALQADASTSMIPGASGPDGGYA
jgi:hypothetical protein